MVRRVSTVAFEGIEARAVDVQCHHDRNAERHSWFDLADFRCGLVAGFFAAACAANARWA